MIARNAYQAPDNYSERRRIGAQPASARGCLVLLLDVKLSYTGCVVVPLWQDPVLARFEDALHAAPTQPEEGRELPLVRVRWRALSMPAETRNS